MFWIRGVAVWLGRSALRLISSMFRKPWLNEFFCVLFEVCLNKILLFPMDLVAASRSSRTRSAGPFTLPRLWREIVDEVCVDWRNCGPDGEESVLRAASVQAGGDCIQGALALCQEII